MDQESKMREEVVPDKAQFDGIMSHEPPISERGVGPPEKVENSAKEKITLEQLADWENQKNQLLESVKNMNVIAHFDTLKEVVTKEQTNTRHVREGDINAQKMGDISEVAVSAGGAQQVVPLEDTTDMHINSVEENNNASTNETTHQDRLEVRASNLVDSSGDLVLDDDENGSRQDRDHSTKSNTNSVQLMDGSAHKRDMGEQTVDCSIREEDLLKTVHRVLEERQEKETRPLPVLLKGKVVDLFRLCIQVRACGGYDKATMKGKWSSISKSIGFGPQCGPLLKLVYVKYLKVLENCTLVASQDKLLPTNTSLEEKATDISLILPSPSDRKRKQPPSMQEEDLVASSVPTGAESVPMAEDMKAFSVMVLWVKRMAVNPGDLRKGLGPKVLKRNEDIERCETLARKYRAVLWKSEVDSHGRPAGSLTRQKRRKISQGDGSSEKDS